MGLFEYLAKRRVRKGLEPHMEKISKAIAWLNEKPGRKRGVGAALFGISAALRYLGHTEAAQAAQASEALLQLLVPGVDILASVFTVIGLAHAKARQD